MTIQSPYRVVLSEGQRAVLRARARRSSGQHRDVLRAKIVLAAADQIPNAVIAHERHRPIRGELTQYPPAVTGRLTGHRHPDEDLRRGLLAGPVQSRTEIPRPAPERPDPLPSQHQVR